MPSYYTCALKASQTCAADSTTVKRQPLAELPFTSLAHSASLSEFLFGQTSKLKFVKCFDYSQGTLHKKFVETISRKQPMRCFASTLGERVLPPPFWHSRIQIPNRSPATILVLVVLITLPLLTLFLLCSWAYVSCQYDIHVHFPTQQQKACRAPHSFGKWGRWL